MHPAKYSRPLLGLIVVALLALFFWKGWPPEEWAPVDATATDTAATQTSTLAGLNQFATEERNAVQATLALIDSGGPFPYTKDGTVFSNREGRLPKKPSGYYLEYTVETPGSPDRGARRIVAGQDGETYYTSDHYDSFVRIR